MADLLPENTKHHEDMNDDSFLPTDWLECTGELYSAVDISYRAFWVISLWEISKPITFNFVLGLTDTSVTSAHGNS
jgi:hypothetical protein